MKQTGQGRVCIGCAGWSVSRRYAAEFGEGGSILQRYATRFAALEINSSFYRPHRPSTYARWAASVPADFRFSVKMPRAISHEQRLRGAEPLLDPFLDAVHELGHRLGGLLLQLPPSLAYDGRAVSAFFRALRRRSTARIACEPRHPSWFADTADAMLREHGISRVAADPAHDQRGGLPGGAQDWTYWRWHGHPRIYYSAYDDAALSALALAAASHAARSDAWVILDNTAHGFATENALRLIELVRDTKAAHRAPGS